MTGQVLTSRSLIVAAASAVVILGMADAAWAQIPGIGIDPWSQMANRVFAAFLNVGRALGGTAVIVGGLMWMFGGHDVSHRAANILFGGVMVFSVVQFVAWAF